MPWKQLHDWPIRVLVQDSSNSGANVQRLEQESNNQMKEIQSNIAAKKKEVSRARQCQLQSQNLAHHVGCTNCQTISRTVSPLSASSACLLQVMDKLLGYVTNVDFKAAASHM